MGRLRPGVTARRRRRKSSDAMRELARLIPRPTATISAEVLAVLALAARPAAHARRRARVLQAVMLLLLLAVCGNTANLVLARASDATARESASASALGAGPRAHRPPDARPRTSCSAVLGAVLGVAIATWGTDALRAVPMPSGLADQVPDAASIS